MDSALTKAGMPDAEPVRQLREQADEEVERDDAMLSAHGSLQVSPDEDVGTDPYNRTGRFQKLVR